MLLYINIRSELLLECHFRRIKRIIPDLRLDEVAEYGTLVHILDDQILNLLPPVSWN